MASKKDLLKSISDEDERKIFAKALDKGDLCAKINVPQFSDFMDPYKAHKLGEICRGCEFNTVLYGGYEDAERLKVGFFPYYDEGDYTSFPISYVEVTYNGKYSKTLTHREFLGSVLGLGITRDKVGDIYIQNEKAVIMVDEDIADYIVSNLERVSHTKVNAKIIDHFESAPSEGNAKKITVASLRIDAVLSGALNISRGKVSDLIKGEKAFVNWKQITSVSENIKDGDMITLRGFGRVKVIETLGKTKKDRFLIDIEIYK